MNLPDRILALAEVLERFPEMKGWDAAALADLADAEMDKAGTRPEVIVHVVSANTPMAGIQSLVRGLLLGSCNLCKIPGEGLPRFAEFVGNLPLELAERVEISQSLPPEWVGKADAVVVFGTDATVDFFRRQMRAGQIFAGYGDRWSGAIIFSDATGESVSRLARDIGLYGQKGCLSAQIVWVDRLVDPVVYGEKLACALADFSASEMIAPLTPGEAAAVARWRLAAEWRLVQEGAGQTWFSNGEPTWGIVLHAGLEAPGLSCLNRHVTLVPFDKPPEMGELGRSLSTLGVWPPDRADEEWLQTTGASRICPVGEMQFPLPSWQQDGFPALGRLVGPDRSALG